ITASVTLYDLHGKPLSENTKTLSLKAHNLVLLDKVTLPGAKNEEVYFLKLILSEKDKVIDENLYWLSNRPKSYEKLNELAKVTLKTDINKTVDNKVIINVSNPGNETAFFIRLKINNQDKELVLPVFFTENYFTLLPGENRQVELDISGACNKNESGELKLVVEGWNIVTEEKRF
ncbi:MAG TPA: hypothetical protein PK521_15630, partial [Bacteroidales bacterium]|nr:hypothetical protein [Bacteroidales bacterium]